MEEAAQYGHYSLNKPMLLPFEHANEESQAAEASPDAQHLGKKAVDSKPFLMAVPKHGSVSLTPRHPLETAAVY
eukprot:2410434-Amphidinium_carterae.1